jgi:hypothetical protein
MRWHGELVRPGSLVAYLPQTTAQGDLSLRELLMNGEDATEGGATGVLRLVWEGAPEAIDALLPVLDRPLRSLPPLRRVWPSSPRSDMGIPTPRTAAELCQSILEHMDRGSAVLLHCRAGLGRTGTMLACTLIALGEAVEEALLTVKRSCPGYIQSPIQHVFLRHFAEFPSREEILFDAPRDEVPRLAGA